VRIKVPLLRDKVLNSVAKLKARQVISLILLGTECILTKQSQQQQQSAVTDDWIYLRMKDWSVSDVCGWRSSMGRTYERHTPTFEEYEVCGRDLIKITDGSLQSLKDEEIVRVRILNKIKEKLEKEERKQILRRDKYPSNPERGVIGGKEVGLASGPYIGEIRMGNLMDHWVYAAIKRMGHMCCCCMNN